MAQWARWLVDNVGRLTDRMHRPKTSEHLSLLPSGLAGLVLYLAECGQFMVERGAPAYCCTGVMGAAACMWVGFYRSC